MKRKRKWKKRKKYEMLGPTEERELASWPRWTSSHETSTRHILLRRTTSCIVLTHSSIDAASTFFYFVIFFHFFTFIYFFLLTQNLAKGFHYLGWVNDDSWSKRHFFFFFLFSFPFPFFFTFLLFFTFFKVCSVHVQFCNKIFKEKKFFFVFILFDSNKKNVTLYIWAG